MNTSTSLAIIGLIILIIILSGTLIYTTSTPQTTQTQQLKPIIKPKPPCEKKDAYYVKTWGGSAYYLSTNLEEAMEMAGDRLVVKRKRCIN